MLPLNMVMPAVRSDAATGWSRATSTTTAWTSYIAKSAGVLHLYGVISTDLVVGSRVPVGDSRRVGDVLLEAMGAKSTKRDGDGAVARTDFPKGLAAHDGGFQVAVACGSRFEQGGFFVGAITRH